MGPDATLAPPGDSRLNIVGVMIWFDESPIWLAACVAGFARVCDSIVAVDGAYALYPGSRPRSHPDQAQAITDACEAMDVGLVLHRPKEVFWGNEVAKRQLSLELARPLEPNWVLVFDSDYLVMQTDPDIVRYDLEQTDLNVATYTMLDNQDLQTDEAAAEYAVTHPVETEWTYQTRAIYRWTDDLEYGPAHWTIRGTYDGRRQWIFGPEAMEEPAMDLQGSLVAVHRRSRRPLVRNEAAKAFADARDTCGIEKFNASLLGGMV